MKRIALALVVVAVLALGAQQAQASPPKYHGPRHHGQQYHHHHKHGGPHGSRYYVPPRVVYPAPVFRPYYRPAYVAPVPVYPYPYHYGPTSGFYYRGSGISIGIGF